MPKRYKYRKNSRGRRRFRRSSRRSTRLSRRYKSKTIVPKTLNYKRSGLTKTNIFGNGVPDVTYVKMRYHCFVDFLSSGYYPSVYVFRANSIWDPDLTSLGHTAYDRYNWAPFYELYHVFGSSISVRTFARAASESESNQTVVRTVIQPNTGTSPWVTDASTWERITEFPRVKYNSGSIYTGGYKTSHYLRPGTILGRSEKDVESDMTFSAGMTANPLSQIYYHLYAFPLYPGISTRDISCEVFITYYVKLFQRKFLFNV